MRAYLNRIVSLLIEPHAATRDGISRQQAKLVSAMLLPMVLLIPFGIALTPNEVEREALLVMVWIFPLLYLLSRSPYAQLAGVIALGVMTVALYYMLVQEKNPDHHIITYYVSWMMAPTMFAALWLPVSWALTYWFLNQAGVLILPMLADELAGANISNPFLQYLLLSSLVFITAYLRALNLKNLQKAGESLAANERRLRRSQIAANIGTWEWNIRNGELNWSERIPALFGYPEGGIETSYENFIAAVHPDDRELVTTAIEASLNDGADYIVEHRIVWPDGTVRWMLEQGDVDRDETGTPVRMLGVVQDITEKKAAESALQAEKDTAQQYLDVAGVVLLVLDREGNITLINRRGAEVLGSSEASLIGRSWFDEFVNDPDIGRLKQTYKQVMDGRAQLETMMENRIANIDGAVRNFFWNNVLLRNSAGDIVGILASGEDVTERNLNEKHLMKARDEAEQANSAKSEFLSRMSHELRTPMNAIIGFAQLIKTNKSVDSSVAEMANEIYTAGDHLLGLINEVLDLSNIEIGIMQMSIENVDPVELAASCMTLTEHLANKAGIRMHNDIVGKQPPVQADYRRLRQLLINFISNAVKYNKKGGQIWLSARETGDGMLRITIRDDGIGIQSSEMGKLFQPFSRVGDHKELVEGTGIGLVIARQLAEMMGGKVDMTSEYGKGSSFWVDMPLAEIPVEAEIPESAVDNTENFGGTGLDGCTIVYIEDNPSNTKLMQVYFSRMAHVELRTADTGKKGLELIERLRPDFALIDINLPDMTGFEILEQAREKGLDRNCKMIALSADALPSQIKSGKQAGFFDYLTKPVQFELLLNTLYRACKSENNANN